MLKLFSNQTVFREVPDEIGLALNISNCPIHCKGCHSKHLWDDVGEPLTEELLKSLISQSKGITCIVLLGGDSDYSEVVKIAKLTKTLNLKFAWYSGNTLIPINDLEYFDYIKIGPYMENRGGLDNPSTNQRFFKVVKEEKNGNVFYCLQDQTLLFQK